MGYLDEALAPISEMRREAGFQAVFKRFQAGRE
jgi:hypothetical protein